MNRISRDVKPSQGIQPHLPIKPLCVPMELSDGFGEEVSGRFTNRVYSLWERLGLIFLEEGDARPQTAENRVVVNNFTQQIIFQLFSQKNIGRLIDFDQPGFVLIDKALSMAKSSDDIMKRRILERLEQRRAQKTEYSRELESVLKLLSGEEVSVSDEKLVRVVGAVVENIRNEELTNVRSASVIKNLRLHMEKREAFTEIARELSSLTENLEAERFKSIAEDILTSVHEARFSDEKAVTDRAAHGYTVSRADIRAVELALAGNSELTSEKTEKLFGEDFPITERFERRPFLTDASDNGTAAEQSEAGFPKPVFGTVISRGEQLYTDAVYFLENKQVKATERFSELSEILRQSGGVGKSNSNYAALHDTEPFERSMTASLMGRVSDYIADKLAREDGLDEYRVLARSGQFAKLLSTGTLGRARRNLVYFENSEVGYSLDGSVSPHRVARYSPAPRITGDFSKRDTTGFYRVLSEERIGTSDNSAVSDALTGGAGFVRAGSVVPSNADTRADSFIASSEFGYTETATDDAGTGSVVPANADSQIISHTNGELSYTETAENAGAVKTGSVVPANAASQTISHTNGELSYTKTSTEAKTQINSAVRAVGRAIPFIRSVINSRARGRNADYGVVLPARRTEITFAESAPDMKSSGSFNNGEIFRESSKNASSYRDKLDSKTLEALDRIISQARGDKPVFTRGTVMRYQEQEPENFGNFNGADISFYAEPEPPRGTLTTDGIVPKGVGDAEMRIFHRGLKNAAKLKSAIIPEKPENTHLARMISVLEKEENAEKQGITAKSGFSFRTVDDGEEMVMLVPPSQMDSRLAENGYVRQLPAIDYKQREEQPPQAAAPSKPKTVNTTQRSVQTVRNAAAGGFENMTREEINKLTDIVYKELQTRIMRERRRFGM